MTSCERVQALLKGEIPDRMGLYEHFWPETLRDYWPQQGYPAGREPVEVFGFDLVACESGIKTEPFVDDRRVVQENAECEVVRDGRGATMRYWKNKSGTPEHLTFEVKTPDVWEKYREPLVSLDRTRLGDLERIKRDLSKARAQGRFSLFGNLFVFELMRATMGDEVFLPALLKEPQWVHDFCRVYLDFLQKHYDLLFRQVGVPDGFWINEDYGYSKGLFCSPATMRQMILPYLKEWVGFLKDYGLAVFLHSCGDIRAAVPLFIEAGIDCLHPMEAKAGCDVLAMAATYGNKITYMGNIDVVALSTNDTPILESEIVSKLQGLRSMRAAYFFASDHSIPPSVSYQTYRYALKLFSENSSY